MTRRIILVRHGQSAQQSGGWLDRRGIEAWLRTYDGAGLDEGEHPPAGLEAIAAGVGIVVASDLPRASESAALLIESLRITRSPRIAESPLIAESARMIDSPRIAESPLLREVPLSIPELGRLRLPVAAWGILIGVQWLRQLSHEPADSPARVQGGAAARWLGALASEHGSVLAVTHGAFRRYLAGALVERGWIHAPRRRSSRPWSGWELSHELDTCVSSPLP